VAREVSSSSNSQSPVLSRALSRPAALAHTHTHTHTHTHVCTHTSGDKRARSSVCYACPESCRGERR
jgi:hypothetical protein